MTRWSGKRLTWTLSACLLVWIAVALACLMVGSTGSIGFPSRDQLPFRREPVLMASLVGAALACAGVVYQAILRNPLADPYLLGVSSGASLAAYLWRFVAVGSLLTGAMTQQAFAFSGAIIAAAGVFAVAGFRGKLEPLSLLLVG